VRNCPEVVDMVTVFFGLVAVGRTDYVSVQCGLYTSHSEVRTKHVMSNGVHLWGRDVMSTTQSLSLPTSDSTAIW
jgi:hypothetical protein